MDSSYSFDVKIKPNVLFKFKETLTIVLNLTIIDDRSELVEAVDVSDCDLSDEHGDNKNNNSNINNNDAGCDLSENREYHVQNMGTTKITHTLYRVTPISDVKTSTIKEGRPTVFNIRSGRKTLIVLN